MMSRWRRAILLVIVTVITYGSFEAFSQSRHNGRRLDQALTSLNQADRRNHDLTVVVLAQTQDIERLRTFLLAHGFTPAQIAQATAGAASAGPAGPPGTSGAAGGGGHHADATPASTPRPSPAPRPSSTSSPAPRPSPHPSPSPSPSARPCTVRNPLDGSCVAPCPTLLCPSGAPELAALLLPPADSVAPVVPGYQSDGLADSLTAWLRGYLSAGLTYSGTHGGTVVVTASGGARPRHSAAL